MDDPLSRRLLWLAGLLSVLLIAVVVNYLLHGGAAALNPVAQAAERTAAMPGAHLKLQVTYSAAGGSRAIVGTGRGAFDARGDRARIELSVPVPGQATVNVESVGDARKVFLRSSAIAGELPPGKEWLGMEPLLGHDPETAFGGRAEGTLRMLEAVAQVERVDREIVRDHQTTRYKTTIDLARVAGLLAEKGEAEPAREYEAFAERAPAPIPVEVWIDDRGLLRLVRMVQQLPTADGGPELTMDMRMEYFAFGAHPKVALPSRSRVLDYTPALRAELGMTDGRSLGSLRPPAGARPLSAAAFRRRATAICRGVAGEAKRLLSQADGLIERMEGMRRGVTDPVEARPLAMAYGLRVGEPLYRLARRGTLRLAALVPPRDRVAAYRRYLTLDVEQLEGVLGQARALQVGAFNSPAIHDTAARETAAKKRRKLVSSLGISSCEKGSRPAHPATSA